MNHQCQTLDFFRLSTAPNEIASFLRKNMQLKEVCQKILYQKIIEQAAQEMGLTVTPEEIQAEAERRRKKHLEQAADTFAWLANQMSSIEDWEAGIRDRLLAQKVSQSLFGKEVEKFFTQNQADFDQVILYQIVVPYEKLAQQLFYQILEEEISFYEVAHLYDIDDSRRYHCGYEGKLYRWNLKPEIAAVVFGAGVGELVGPITTDQGVHLLTVEEFIPAELTSTRYQDILNRMFMQWLECELNYLLLTKC
ncbi:peptidylprolyl isomerase [Chroococcidiopsis sp. CCMEE 29]|uniref:peptidylprolyl isomerase n=1 Tax=Chroococcidiopsis sp. CCMEE 29 TaxID=155894 RepID=UPI002020C7C6|nr:peptidylprolyl isomerase [Chroococcidiopsis sp. CCMEE 29]